jgi:hypothetical protein
MGKGRWRKPLGAVLTAIGLALLAFGFAQLGGPSQGEAALIPGAIITASGVDVWTGPNRWNWRSGSPYGFTLAGLWVIVGAAMWLLGGDPLAGIPLSVLGLLIFLAWGVLGLIRSRRAARAHP